MKGFQLDLKLGKNLENNNIVLARRDTGNKETLDISNLLNAIPKH